MKNKLFTVAIGICLIVSFAFATESFARKKRIVFGGGPAGGTFQVVANAIQVYKPVKEIKSSPSKPNPLLGRLRTYEKSIPENQILASYIPVTCT